MIVDTYENELNDTIATHLARVIAMNKQCRGSVAVSNWTIFLIVLTLFTLYWVVVALLKISLFVCWILSFFEKKPTNQFKISTELREFKSGQSRLNALQSGSVRPQYRIEYSDSNGEITDRDIYIFNVNEPYLHCWCFSADDRRTFRIDRLLSAIDLSTGQPIRHIRAHWRNHH